MTERTPTDAQDSTPRRRAVPNTRSRDESLMMLLDGAATRDPSGAIERQEARGQRDLVASDVLPTEIDPRSKAALEAAGVVFGEAVEGDPLFSYVTLPAGWKKSGTDHAMWSDLLDDQGRKRAGIFYKAASYDRAAHMSATRRLSAGLDYSESAYKAQRERNEYVGLVMDGEAVIHRVVFADSGNVERYDDDSAYNRARAAANVWLAEHYPDANDPAAYWDLPPVQAVEAPR